MAHLDSSQGSYHTLEGVTAPSDEEIRKNSETLRVLEDLYTRYQRIKRKIELLKQAISSQFPTTVDLRTQAERLEKMEILVLGFRDLRRTKDESQLEIAKIQREVAQQDQVRQRIITDLSSLESCMLCGAELEPGKAKEHLEKVGIHSI